jgi:hypothetical protein
MTQGTSRGTVHSVGDASELVSAGFRLDPSLAYPRDKSFKLVELAFLQVLPAARSKRAALVFASAGFEGDVREKLHGIYRRHDVPGVSLDAPSLGFEVNPSPLKQLEQDFGAPNAARFDCVSLLGSGAARRVLEMVSRGTYRPGLIHCADKDSFDDWAELWNGLAALGYACVGELEGAEIFIDAPLFDAPDVRPRLSTFDVFDTLIARRCFEPWRVFEKVGELAGIADFVEERRQAEGRVIEQKYVFDDIYDELARHYGWSEQRRREVQALELQCEMEVAIPIAENLARVRDGDLLVSDMYLSETAIRGLLQKAGLTAHVGLLVESHGKSSGRVWPLIDAQFKVTEHLGDNPHADVAVPARFGFEATLTRTSDLNLVERTLLQAGLRDLALFCREARLASWHEDPTLRALQSIQTSLNLPILLLASVTVARRAVALGKTSIAFCSRDCNLWLPLFNIVQAKMGLSLKTSYFLTSRIARKQGSDTYLDYARDLIGPDTLVVDLCGTGWSMANLVERLGLGSCDLFLIDHCPPLDAFERTKPTPPTCTIHPLFDKRPNGNNIVLELANMADHGMVVDMRQMGSTRVPAFAPNPLSSEEVEAVNEQRACFLASLDLIENHNLQDVLDLDDPSIAFLCSSLYEFMSRQTDCFQIFAQRFLTENEEIVRALTR